MPEKVEILFKGGPFDGDTQVVPGASLKVNFVRLNPAGTHLYQRDEGSDSPVFRYVKTLDEPTEEKGDA